MMNSIFSFITLILFLPSLAFASPSVTIGKTIYNTHCWFCHGQKGDGKSDARAVLRPKPKNFTDPKTIAELSYGRIVQSIINGRPKTAMPSFKNTITKNEIKSVALYIKNVIMKGKPPAAAYNAHNDRYNSIDYSAIKNDSDIKICLLHCHVDEKFIRDRLNLIKRKKKGEPND